MRQKANQQTKLPATIAELNIKLQQGGLDLSEILQAQGERVRQDKWNAVVATLENAATSCSYEPPYESSNAEGVPLLGVGVGYKDMFKLPGRNPSCGAKVAPDFDAPVSPLFERLQAAGSSALASLSMSEFAMGITAQNPYTELPINPLNSELAVGGSSGGSAVAVSAGMCYVSLGTDTAGSVRVPAATCGVLGLKPTNGLLSTIGCYPLAPTLDTVGLLGRSVDDLATVLGVCTGQLYSKEGRLMRVAASYKHFVPSWSASAKTRDVLYQVANDYSPNKTDIFIGEINMLETLSRNAEVVLRAESTATHYQRLQRGQELSDDARAFVLPGVAMPNIWYLKALQARTALQKQFLDLYFHDRNVDVLLTPVLPHGIPTWKQVDTRSKHFDAHQLLSMLAWAGFVNYLGLPAITIPIYKDGDGQVISIQAIGKPRAEADLIIFAKQIEEHFTAL